MPRGRKTLARNDFADLFRSHAASLFRMAYWYVKEEEAAYDLVQSAFERAMTRRDEFRGDSSLRSWVTAILINLAKNYLRDNSRSEPTASLPEPDGNGESPVMGQPPMSPLAAAVATESMARLAAAYESLPPRQKEVLRLRIEQGFSFAEIAQALDISSGDARVNYHYAVRRLKGLLSEDEAAAPPLADIKPRAGNG